MASKSFIASVLVVVSTLLLQQSNGVILPNDEVPEALRDRLWSSGTTAPMARYFQSNSTVAASLGELKKHMQDVDNRLSALYNSRKPYGLGPDDIICNRRQRNSEQAIYYKLRDLHLPQIAENCITELDMQYSAEEHRKLWAARKTFIEGTRQAGLAAVNEFNRRDWRGKAYPHAKFSYTDHIDTCELIHNVGFRIRGEWAVMSSLTQFPVLIDRGDRRRQYMVEYLTYRNGTVGNIKVRLPRMGTKEEFVDNTTTTWENWLGRPGASIFRQRTPLDENPAIAAALDAKADWREQVEDARYASNISILVLSCLFTLIPLASFADVSLVALFIYTCVTDIMTCVPLSIKGIELLRESRNYDTTVVWAFGGINPSLAQKHSLVVESWSASCKTVNDVRYTGIVYVTFAIVLMIIGVALEVMVLRRMKRQKILHDTRRFHEAHHHSKYTYDYDVRT